MINKQCVTVSFSGLQSLDNHFQSKNSDSSSNNNDNNNNNIFFP